METPKRADIRKIISYVARVFGVILLASCSFLKGPTPTPSTSIPSEQPKTPQNICSKEEILGQGKLFHEAVDWNDSGNDPSHRGSVLSLNGVYVIVDENGITREREDGELGKMCWIFGPNGERLYYDDVGGFAPE